MFYIDVIFASRNHHAVFETARSEHDAFTGETLVFSYPWLSERRVEILQLFVDLGDAHISLYGFLIDAAVIPGSPAAVPENSERDQQSDAAHDESAYRHHEQAQYHCQNSNGGYRFIFFHVG